MMTICNDCGFGYDAGRFLTCPAVHNPPTETEFRLHSQRKEIERLREENEALTAIIRSLTADKIALSEMLMRASEYVETMTELKPGHSPSAFIARIADIFKRIG